MAMCVNNIHAEVIANPFHEMYQSDMMLKGLVENNHLHLPNAIHIFENVLK